MNNIYNIKKKYILETDIDDSYGLDSYTLYNRLLNHIPYNSKVLEIGCGMGHFSNHCYGSNTSVISSDIGMLKMKQTKNCYPHLSYCLADAEILPFKDNYFDVVVSNDLIEHLFNQESHLSEVYRILKNNGVYIIKTPNKIYDLAINFPYYILIKGISYNLLKQIHPSTKYYFEFKKLLNHYGFHAKFYSLGQMSEIQKRKVGKFSNYIEKVVFKYFPLALQPSFFCVARKKKDIDRIKNANY